MADDRDARVGPTRRRYLGGTAALLGGTFTGCLGGDSSDGDGDDSGGENADDGSTGDGTDSEGSTGNSDGDGGSSDGDDAADTYSVSMVPVGEVEFDGVPETWVANNGSWADMGIALGLEPPEALWLTGRYHTQYYDEIPDVSVDESEMVSLYDSGVSKELFYELDADVHVMDPNFLVNRFQGWEQGDVDEIEEYVAPFFGNSIYASHYPWHDDYRYYSLYEGFEKLAQVFQRTDRYEAFESIHDDFQANLAPIVPNTSEAPSVAVVWGAGDEPSTFYPYVIGGGTGFKHLRELGVHDAFAESDVKDFHGSRGAIDYETLLDVDPEVLLLRGQEAKTAEAFQDTVVSHFEDHDTASQLTAVQNGEVYRAGGLYAGPITNMVLTERLASDLYDTDEELFDRQRVADVVAGEI